MGRKRAMGFAGFFVLSIVISPVVVAIILLGTKRFDKSRP
jgi:hypothetical protein